MLTSIKKRSNAATGSVDNQYFADRLSVFLLLVKTSGYQIKLFVFKSIEASLFKTPFVEIY